MGVRVTPKTVIYLDQNVISNITKALDPEFPRQAKVIAEGWLDVYKKIERLRRLQLVVCPESRFRRAESLLSRDPPYVSLQDVYTYLSSGCVFEDAHTILEWQILHHFQHYLDGHPDREPAISVDEVVLGDLHDWEEFLAISVQYQPHPTDITVRRDRRQADEARLLEAFRLWQSDATPFKKTVQEEAQELARALLANMAQDLMRLLNPRSPIDLLPSPATRLFYGMCGILQGSGYVERSQYSDLVGEYLRDPCLLLRVPFVRLSAMLYASLARQTQAGRRRPPTPGTIVDVSAIASLLPYCGAMFVDNEMASCLRETPLNGEVESLGVRVFSPRSKAEFLSFLDELEISAGPLYLSVVRDHYGPDWLDPNLNLVVDGRERRSRRFASGE